MTATQHPTSLPNSQRTTCTAIQSAIPTLILVITKTALKTTYIPVKLYAQQPAINPIIKRIQAPAIQATANVTVLTTI